MWQCSAEAFPITSRVKERVRRGEEQFEKSSFSAVATGGSKPKAVGFECLFVGIE